MRKGQKRILRTVAAFLCTVLITLTLATAAAAEQYPYLTTTTDKVNLRKTASGSADVLTRVEKGAEVTVTGKSGNYFKVTYGKYTGYILAEFLTPYDQVADVQPTPEVVYGYPYETTTLDSVNLRKTNSQVSERLLTIPKGATVTVVGETAQYARLQYKGVEGYARKEYVNMKTLVKATATPAPTPTPAPTFNIPSSTVERGSSGSDARLVQQRLKDLGYYKGTIDGKFGSSSVSALIAFQQKHGLNADGKAGQATYAILFSVNALPVNVTPTPVVLATLPPAVTPVPTSTPAPVEISKENVVTIRLGTQGDAVSRLQQRLTALGYYQATVDGVCKADDVAAIRAFQRLNSLTVDGVAGYLTQVRLYAESAVLYTGGVAAGTVSAYSTLRMGMTGSEVRQMQERLIALGYLEGKADGVYGSSTANAVIAFQRTNGLAKDGVAGPKTLQAIYSGKAIKAVSATPTPAPAAVSAASASSTNLANSSTLHLGDKSTAVKTMQQRLIDLGYLRGKPDGVFGSKTFEALKAFQRANRLKADGIAGSKTLQALDSTAAITVNGTVAATPVPTAVPTASANAKPRASQVIYENWYTTIKAKVKRYQYATVYDFKSGISWQVHMFSFGAHADAEPLTANDTAKMEQAFGGNTWNPKAVWVVLGDGSVYMASTHSMPHEVQHIKSNNFNGHLCIHFPRTQAQVTAIGPYATSHQAAIDAGWKITQSMK